MKRTILAAGLALGLTIAGASAPAFATPPPEECIPSDAWTEVIPDIEHPAVTEVIEHPATYETVEVTPAVPEVAEQSFIEFQWKWWGKKGHGTTVWSATMPTERLNDVKDRGNYGDWRKNGNERKVITQPHVPGVPAVTEERTLTEAYTETVVIEEAYTEVIPDIEHPAVECEAPPVVVDPPTEEPPVVVPPVTEPPVEVPAPAAPAPLAAQPVSDGVGGDEPTTLAQTGGGVSPLAIGGGVLALLVGALLVLRRRIFGTV